MWQAKPECLHLAASTAAVVSLTVSCHAVRFISVTPWRDIVIVLLLQAPGATKHHDSFNCQLSNVSK